MSFEKGDRVWIPHDKDAWIVGVVKSADARQTEFLTEKYATLTFDTKDCNDFEGCGNHLDNDVENLVDLDELSEGAILHHVSKRFRKQNIYTFVGPILVAVNPFERLPIYEAVDIRRASAHATPYPHIFVTAAVAYQQLKENRSSQSVLISGESGAGKTETTKKVLTYLATIAPADAAESEDRGGIEERILMSNPLLEALGNAKTSRNNNSSRFGKYIKLEFDAHNKIHSCEIENYLLEKSRVVSQNPMERNYHIFYMLCTGTDPALRASLKLKDPMSYRFLSTSGCLTIDGVDDMAEFQDVQRAMILLQIDESMQLDMFKLVSAALTIGNIKFKKDDNDNAEVDGSEEEIKIAAEHLAIDETTFKSALTEKSVMVGREMVTIKFNLNQADDSRDTVAKTLYGLMFDFTVKLLNKSLANPNGGVSHPLHIGILDIFGFEIFEVNSFEQLCINFANEKLQLHFNSVIFGQEMKMYEEEGISLDKVDFVDNSLCVQLVEGKPLGLISLLEEECSLGGGTDLNYISKIDKTFGSGRKDENPHFSKNRTKPNLFNVHHFAGVVEYCVDSWLDKNRDTLSPSVRQTMQESSKPFVSDLFQDAEEDPAAAAKPGRKKGGKSTLGTQFRNQLISLVTDLKATEPHFVRCVKPNYAKVGGGVIEAHLVLGQMRYSGLFEAIRIRKSGFSYRATHAQFAGSYRLLDDEVPILMKNGKISDSDACAKILESVYKDGVISRDVCAFGNTKVFLKNNSDRAHLEAHKRVRVEKYAVKIQARYRIILAKKVSAKLYWAAHEEEEVAQNKRNLVHNSAKTMQRVWRGKMARIQVRELADFIFLKNAIDSQNMNGVVKYMEIIEARPAMLESPHCHMFLKTVHQARTLVKLLELQKNFLQDLALCRMDESYADMRTLVQKASRLELQGHPDVLSAGQELENLTRKHRVMKKMALFLKNSQYSATDPSGMLSEAAELGIDQTFIEKVSRVNDSTGPLLRARQSIRRAVESISKEGALRALEEVKELQKFYPGFLEIECRAAKKMLKMLEFQDYLCSNTHSSGASSETKEEKEDKDKESGGPILTPAVIDLCEIICSSDDMKLARQAHQRMQMMTKSAAALEEILRCFKWSKLVCSWKWPKNARREAKLSGTNTNQSARDAFHESMGIGAGSSPTKGGNYDDSDDEADEFDFFGLRASDARQGVYLQRVLGGQFDDEQDKDHFEEDMQASLMEKNKALPLGVEDTIKKLDVLSVRDEDETRDAAGVFSFASLGGESKRGKKGKGKAAITEKLHDRTSEGHKARMKVQTETYKRDQCNTLIPPSITRTVEASSVKPKPRTEYIALPQSLEDKLLASRKGLEKQKKSKIRAFSHIKNAPGGEGENKKRAFR